MDGELETLIIHIEIERKEESIMSSNEIKSEVAKYLNGSKLVLGSVLTGVVLTRHLNSIRICEIDNRKFLKDTVRIPSPNIELMFHVYATNSVGPNVELMDDENDCDVPSCEHWLLPNIEFQDLWENLIYDDNIKDDLLRYVETLVRCSHHKIQAHVISWNSVVLLHGPPGTGKTSLCKALAHKLAIRLNSYQHFQLVEINTHSLFSKWFSESGKLVMKMFDTIKQWLNNTSSFVCILIDEVESLAHARKLSMSGSDPSDSVRVVNAVLTQIDQIKRYPNVLILATSNITGAIDVAFADRADIKHYIGYPSQWAVYHILKSCIDEMLLKKLIRGNNTELLNKNIVKKLITSGIDASESGTAMNASKQLVDLCKLCVGFSGRTLRKLPFLALTTHIYDKNEPTICKFMSSMVVVAKKMKADNMHFFQAN